MALPSRLYISQVIEDGERSPFAIILSPEIDGNIADVYGETAQEAKQVAEEICLKLRAVEWIEKMLLKDPRAVMTMINKALTFMNPLVDTIIEQIGRD